MLPKVQRIEPVTPAQIQMIAKNLGIGAVIANMGKADPSKGAGIIDSKTKCLWTKDGKRITLSLQHGTLIASCDKTTDPDCPK